MDTNNWYALDNWNNSRLSYNKDKNVMFFDTNEEYEDAVISFPVPDDAKSFSLSFKIGNSCPVSKPGLQDSAKVTVGFGNSDLKENVKGIATPYIVDKDYFVIYSLGSEEKPVCIGGDNPRCFYFQVEAHNADNDEMDVYFGNFDLQFYDKNGYVEFTEYVPFEVQETNEIVTVGSAMEFRRIGGLFLILACAAIGVLNFVWGNKKGENKVKE